MRKIFKVTLIFYLVCTLPVLTLPNYARADAIATSEVLDNNLNKMQVTSFLARQDVQQELFKFGVSADEALQRVNAMTDREVNELAEVIRSAPAGGEGLGTVLVVVVFVFVLLLITDIFGFTKVYPFTRSLR